MKIDRGTVILAIIGGFAVFMIWSVMVNSMDNPGSRVGEASPVPAKEGLNALGQ